MRNHFYLRRIWGPLLLALFLAFSLLPQTAQASSKIALNDPCHTNGTTCNPPLIYHDGPVQHHPKVYLIFWGPKWTTADPTYIAINNLFTSLPGGVYNALLMQYYDGSDYVHNDVQVAGTWIDTQAPPAAGIGVTYTTDSIYSEMFNALYTHQNWQATEDAQFMVFPQAGTTINNGENECGRHEWIVVNHVNYYYSYVDTGGMKANCPGDAGGITAEITHEYAETATDPQASSQYIINGSGWTTTDNNSGEIGDLCEVSPTISTYVPYNNDVLNINPTVQELWDNYTNSCTSSVLNSGEYLAPAGSTNGKKHTVQGYIWKTYTSGNYQSLLGLPVSEQEQVTADGLVSYFAGQQCSGGYKEPETGQTSGSAIYSSLTVGYNAPGNLAYEVQGCNYTLYTNVLGGPAGPLGFPVSNEQDLAGGRVSYFAGQQCGGGYNFPNNPQNQISGSAIFFNGTSYEVQGCIYNKYMNSMGGPGGLLGFPVSNEEGLAGGRVSYFGGQQCNGGYKVPDNGQLSGSAIFYNSNPYEVQGCIYSTYMNQAGGPASIGFPVSDMQGYNNGLVSYFAGNGGKQCNGGYKAPVTGNLSGAAIFDYYYNTGYEVTGCVYTAYMNQFGGPGGRLNFPVSNEEPIDGGRVSYFGGALCGNGYTVPDTATTSGSAIFYNGTPYEVLDCIYNTYMTQFGGPAGIGFPVSNEEGVPGANVSYFAGNGGKQCAGGYKVPDTGNLSGAAIFYDGNPGDKTYGVLGCIYTLYMNQFGGAAGQLGPPVSNEEALAGGRVSYFSGALCGSGGYKVPDTGNMSGSAIFYNGPFYGVQGCIYNMYMNKLGGPAGFGFPVSNEEGIGKGRVSYFAGNKCGTGYKVPDTGNVSGDAIFYDYRSAYEVQGCIYNAYMNQFGGPNGLLGFPVTSEQGIANGRVSYFSGPLCSRGGYTLPGGIASGSAIFYSGNPYEVHGCIYDTYMGLGGPNSKLGFPISNEFSYDSANDRQSTFQHGYIQWSATTNLTSVHYT